MPAVSHRLLRVSTRSAATIALAGALLLAVSNLCHASITVHNPTTSSAVGVVLGDRVGFVKALTPTGRFVQPSGATVAILAICDSHAGVLVYRSFNVGPFDPTWLPVPNLTVPTWLMVAGFLGSALLIHRLAHRKARGLCRRCFYDLRGLPPSCPCPECGRGSEAPRPGRPPTERPKADTPAPA